MTPDELARLAEQLRTLPERTPEPDDVPSSWLQRDDGTWSAVYPDGMVGEPFSFAQMLAIRGEDIGEIPEWLAFDSAPATGHYGTGGLASAPILDALLGDADASARDSGNGHGADGPGTTN
jgi:hypothetical protein